MEPGKNLITVASYREARANNIVSERHKSKESKFKKSTKIQEPGGSLE